MKRLKWLAVLCAITLTAASSGGFAVPAAAESPDAYYVENEWNFANGSMDISGGIPDDASGALDRIRRKGVLRVGTEPYNPPMSYINFAKGGNEHYAGADMELARRIAERMGVKLEIIPMDYIQLLPSLSEDQCDLTISAISFTPGRASAYTLSKGYYFPEGGSATGFVVREEDAGKITSKGDLEDKILVAKSNSLQEALTAEQVHSYLEFRRVTSIQTVYESVQEGRADVGVVDTESAENYILNNPGCGLVLVEGFTIRPDEHYTGYRVAAKKGEVQLMFFVNGVIDEVTESGEYGRWIGNAH